MAQTHTETTIARLTIDLPLAMHQVIKTHATLDNLSIKDYVIDAITDKISRENAVERKLNKRTIAVLRHSLKNQGKLKTFNNSDDAMKWLLSDDTKTKKPKKKNEKNKILK